ncbi:hypothetical protein QOZ80_3AG0218190 [Eleusine coracana subsp. coracana]|nr:hypothetical protein QOZ80_3AG0218190 [Eleusine coracana subsp. coracana]
MEAKFFRFLKLFSAPPGVRVFCFKPNIICCAGIDRDRVHQFAGAVRICKFHEKYKGKGLSYLEEPRPRLRAW